MKKLIFLIGVATGFVLGSRMGRGPYEQIEEAAREVMNHPKVQSTLHTAADGAESVRDAALDATKGAIDEATHAATRSIDEASRSVKNGSHSAAPKARTGA